MSKHLLTTILIATLSSCVSSVNNESKILTGRKNLIDNAQPVTSSFRDVDTSYIIPHDLPANEKPLSLMELPRTEDGAFVLSGGFYEADFKTYCLQPGTPGPSEKDIYFQAPLKGSRSDIVETILRNSQKKPDLEQKNIQLLLWSVVSRSDYNKLSPSVQSTAMQLLSAKQLFELRGGVASVVKTVIKVIPPSGGQRTLQQLFEIGNSSYESFERLAVSTTPAAISRPDFKHHQWYKQEEGYYVRYYPGSYKQTRIQVYVPESAVPATTDSVATYLVFDPTSMVVVPANSDAQRLGVGAPVIDIVRSVIKVIGKVKPKAKEPKKETPPTTGHPGMDH